MRRKIFAILLCGVLVISVTACGSSESSEETEDAQVEEQVEEQKTEPVDEAEEKQLEEEQIEEEQPSKEQAEKESKSEQLIWCFESLAKQVNLALMEEALRYVDDTGLDYDVVEPSDTELGTITTVDDENGCHLYVAFFPDDNENNTICTVSYGNEHFSGSVDDMTHVTDPIYKTYNYNDETPNTEVASLDDVMEYIETKMPKLIEEDK